MTDAGPRPARLFDRLAELARREAPLGLAVALVGVVLGGLLIGYEPVGGDPDRLYRPLKSELARSLAVGKLPFWSERFGLGVPLMAESHVAAFYPPNLLVYRVFDVSMAYRLSMWLHYVALVATTYAYARCLKLTQWGSALVGVSFALCGFQAIHSSHEPFYCVMPYLPLALAIAELYLASGRALWLALLALALGTQWTLGHFQIQAWTGGLVVLTGLWRWTVDRRSWKRAVALIAATLWGAALAAVQLGPSWQFAETVGQTRRSTGELLYYSFPPIHWFEPALPQLIRDLRLGPQDPYWFSQATWGYEATLYIGIIPLILVFPGIFARAGKRSTMLWLVLAPLSFALATMPRWWPQGNLYLLALPGFGYFRVPARYTLITSLGLSVLAGAGFDRSISIGRFRLGLATSIVFGAGATAAAIFWSMRADVHLRSLFGGIPLGFIWAAFAWPIALVTLFLWRTGRLGSGVPLAAAAVELGILFYLGTTEWGWAVDLPARSSILSELSRRSPQGLIGGETENLPVRAGLGTAYPYLGFAHPTLNGLLVRVQDQLGQADHSRQADGLDEASVKRWLRRCRVSFLVGSKRAILSLGKGLENFRDSALDRVARREPGDPPERSWSIVELAGPFPEARVASQARIAASIRELLARLAREDYLDSAWYLAEDRVLERTAARSARLVSWDGANAVVEHDGPCDLVVARSFDPGWTVRINGGVEERVLRVDAGCLGVRLAGSGNDRVELRYSPPGWGRWLLISAFTATAVTIVLVLSVASGLRARRVGARDGPIKD